MGTSGICLRGHSAQGETTRSMPLHPDHPSSVTGVMQCLCKLNSRQKNICKALSNTDPLDFFMRARLSFIKMCWGQSPMGGKIKGSSATWGSGVKHNATETHPNPGGLHLPIKPIFISFLNIKNGLLTEQAGRCSEAWDEISGHLWPADDWLTDQFPKRLWRLIKFSSMCILMIVASLFKAFCHWKHSGCCQAVYWTGWAATSCNWMSIRPKQFWLIHSTSLSIFTCSDYIWQIVTFSWTLWLEAWAYSWQWAQSWCLMFISYSVFTFPTTAV